MGDALGGNHGNAEIAQLVEHVTENHGVASSILALGTDMRAWFSGRMSPCQGEGHGFESRRPLLKQWLVANG